MNELTQTLYGNRIKLATIFIINTAAYWALLVNSSLFFMDDYSRVLDGWGWNFNGRFLTTRAYQFFLQSRKILYMGSLPQLGALAIYSVLSILLVHRLTGKVRLRHALMSIVIAIFPYTVESMAYKYDSLPMSAALLLSCLPLFLKISTKSSVTSVLALLAAMLLYQQALNAYLILVAYFFMMSILEGKKLTKSLSFTLYYIVLIGVAFIILLVLTKIGLVTYDDPYTLPRAGLASSNPLTLLGSVVVHAGQFFSTEMVWWANSSMGTAWLSVAALFYVVVTIGALKQLRVRKSLVEKSVSVILVLLALAMIIIGPTFVSLFPSYYAVHFRYFYSGSVAMAISFIYIDQIFTQTRFNVMVKALSTFTLMAFFSFTVITTNALDLQSKYYNEQFLILSSDLDELQQQYSIRQVSHQGHLANSNQIRLYRELYPVIDGLVDSSIIAWVRQDFYKSYGLDLRVIDTMEPSSNTKIIKQRGKWDIYLEDNNTVIVVFK